MRHTHMTAPDGRASTISVASTHAIVRRRKLQGWSVHPCDCTPKDLAWWTSGAAPVLRTFSL